MLPLGPSGRPFWLTFSPSSGSKSRIPAGNFTAPGCVSLIRWLGGIETPRLNVTRGPHAPPRRCGGMFFSQFYADAHRHCPAVAVHALGAQAALLPHHVRNRLGRRIFAATGRTWRRLPQRPGKATGLPRTKHHVHVSRPDSRGRGQHAIRTALLLHLQGLPRHPRPGQVRRRQSRQY